MKAVFLYLSILLLVACSKPETPEAPPAKVAVTVTSARSRNLEVWEESIGELEAIEAPRLAAEVGGRIVAVTADVGDQVTPGQVLARIESEDYRLARDLASADIARLEALIRARRLQVRRLRELVKRQSASQAELDEAEARFGALLGQLQEARVRRQRAERNLEKTRIVSPVAGRVDVRRVAAGDYVEAGTPVFDLTDLSRLRARLPYPESLAGKLKPGLPVRLTTPLAPGQAVEAVVSDLRPTVRRGSRALEVIVDFPNPGDWRPGASVTARVRVARREDAVMVPESAVVARPAGKVVYVIERGRARQRRVRTGLVQNGQVEIVEGLAAGETVAVDGAGFLTDGTAVVVKP